ncbi:hypothetical protein BDZ89DRAFT_1069011, partial [Hymenopellis radicata]
MTSSSTSNRTAEDILAEVDWQWSPSQKRPRIHQIIYKDAEGRELVLEVHHKYADYKSLAWSIADLNEIVSDLSHSHFGWWEGQGGLGVL